MDCSNGVDIIGQSEVIEIEKVFDINDAGTLNENGNNDQGDAFGTMPVKYGEIYAPMPVERDAVFYNMKHKKRGMALIFNHEYFDVAGLKPRAGTSEDCTNLKKCLGNLDFDVQVFKDLKYQAIEGHIEQASKRDHSDHDCIVVSILSHGEQGIIYAKDTHYKPDVLWSYFTPDRCPTLAGKPKIFFIQACQGDRLDPGVRVVRSETDGNVVASYRIPLQADFLIMYSTVKGYYSWRNTDKGSWFIQVLAKELESRAYNCDLITILTFVNQRVAIDFQSYVPESPIMHEQKQMPCIMSMLTRLVQFTKKC
ncbi:hypothetical protein WA026_018410 [Henosepilachna vigintioctopunctata]|uniref:Caspase-1 n=1 Tax=Henosepilachna vigintioctopunctata TaxID=420089 RepID=A0AAW1V1V1_9CUCU